MDKGAAFILLFLAAAVIVPFIMRDRLRKRRKKDLICLQCGTVGDVGNKTPGSLLIEIVLWLAFIIPGLIYSLWRHSARRGVCRICGAAQLVPVDTPRGRAMIKNRATA